LTNFAGRSSLEMNWEDMMVGGKCPMRVQILFEFFQQQTVLFNRKKGGFPFPNGVASTT